MNTTRLTRAASFLLCTLFLGWTAQSAETGEAGGAPPRPPSSLYSIVPVLTGFDGPVGVTHAGDGSGRLFVVEQKGTIQILQNGVRRATPFLNLIGRVSSCSGGCGERGLLGLAFHPSYESNGFFFVYYTRASDGDVVIARYHVSADPNLGDLNSELILKTIEHSSQANHNGGQLAFGPDGYLYAGVGDGGGGGDPFENGQNTSALLGKLLRLDVDAAAPYIPATNPFNGTNGAREVWAYGLRNPWRFSFDRQTGDLYIGDVGQNRVEEIDFQPAGAAGGRNYGWDVLEGSLCFEDNPAGSCTALLNGGSVLPIVEYSSADPTPECSVTGGFVYRGGVSSILSGNYLFADFCTGSIRRAVPNGQGQWTASQLVDTNFGPSSFGEDERGRLYFSDLFGNSVQWIAPYSFADTPPTYWAWDFVEALYAAGITDGCGGSNFCPDARTTREQMATFLLRTAEGPTYVPPACTTPVFNDVPCSNSFAVWINDLAAHGITNGCGNGNYCPADGVTRIQMAIFILRTLEGGAYNPPACTTPMFNDVPCSNPFAGWVNELARRGITNGCGGGNYCPATVVTRAQMAIFLSRALGLSPP